MITRTIGFDQFLILATRFLKLWWSVGFMVIFLSNSIQLSIIHETLSVSALKGHCMWWCFAVVWGQHIFGRPYQCSINSLRATHNYQALIIFIWPIDRLFYAVLLPPAFSMIVFTSQTSYNWNFSCFTIKSLRNYIFFKGWHSIYIK